MVRRIHHRVPRREADAAVGARVSLKQVDGGGNVQVRQARDPDRSQGLENLIASTSYESAQVVRVVEDKRVVSGHVAQQFFADSVVRPTKIVGQRVLFISAALGAFLQDFGSVIIRSLNVRDADDFVASHELGVDLVTSFSRAHPCC